MCGIPEVQVRTKLKKHVRCNRQLAYWNVAFCFLEAFQCELDLDVIEGSRVETTQIVQSTQGRKIVINSLV